VADDELLTVLREIRDEVRLLREADEKSAQIRDQERELRNTQRQEWQERMRELSASRQSNAWLWQVTILTLASLFGLMVVANLLADWLSSSPSP